jgi:hypothetical protein
MQMPGCCGIYLVKNFGHTKLNEADRVGEYKPSKKEVESYLIAWLKSFPSRGFVCYINHEQREAIGEAIIAAGFTESFKFAHIAHNSVIYQYIKLPN